MRTDKGKLAERSAVASCPRRWGRGRPHDSRRDGGATKAPNKFLVGLLAVGVLFVLPACSVNVKKERDGQDKQVDIRTPVGGIHVSKDADAGDVGLAVYPGARLKEKGSGDDDKSANVNVSGFGFNIRVVALQYQSDDSPAKILAFYRDQLKKYGGSILECHTASHLNVDMKTSRSDSHALTCDGTHGDNVELKVGTRENQHIVAVEPDGKGSSFSLVYVRTHGKDADI